MRNAYQSKLDTLMHDLVRMAEYVIELMEESSKALLTGDKALAKEVIANVNTLEERRTKAESAAFGMLALEGPVAGDLRRIIAAQHIIEDFARQGAYCVQIAKIAKRRAPKIAIPEEYQADFQQLASLTLDAAQKVKDLINKMDAERALELAVDDDAVDDLYKALYKASTKKSWAHTARQAVDVTMVARCYERFCDHAVNIGSRVVFMATGLRPETYVSDKKTAAQRAEILRQFDEITRRYDSFDDGDDDNADD